MSYEYCTLAAWAATGSLIPYALIRRLYELLACLVILFGMLSLPVMISIERPNPDMVKPVQVVAP